MVLFGALHADVPRRMEDDHVVVHYDRGLENKAREVLSIYSRISRDLEGILGWEIDFKPRVVLIGDNERFQEVVANSHVIAFASPREALIVIDHSRMGGEPFTLGVTLKHEMCHIILGRNISQDRLPRWLNEGFCQWVTGGIAELMVGGGQSALKKASLSDQLIPLRFLSKDFPGEKNALILAYEQSRSALDYMITEYGTESVLRLFGYLRDGDTIDEAFGKSMSLGADEFEKRWVAHLRENVTWIGYIAANIYAILLFAAALLTVGGFVRHMRRRLKNSWLDDDDEGLPG